MNPRAALSAELSPGVERLSGLFSSLVNRAAAHRPAAGNDDRPGCAVRVASGMHRGATLRLREAARLGSDESNDIVLRDPGVLPHHAELRRVDGVWALCDLDHGRTAAAIETAQRGRFERRRYGIGAAQIVISQARPLLLARRRVRARLVRLAAPLLLLLSAVLGAVVIVQLVQPAVARSPAVARNLGAVGFADVQLAAAPGEPTVFSGYVDDAAGLARLQAWMQQNARGPNSVQVRVGSELAARVREALQAPGLSVDYRGAGVVRVQGSTEDAAVRERLRRAAADLARAVRIDDQVAFIETPNTARIEHPLPVRIVDVMPGENGSFSNGSGARYFAGAVLPDGSEVVAVRAEAIEFAVGSRRITYPLK